MAGIFAFNAFPWKRAIGWSGAQGDFPQRIAAEAQLGVQLADLERDEYGFLAGVTQGVIGATQAAVAGQFSFVQLIGPAAGGQLVIFDEVFIRTGGGAVQLYMGTAVAAGAAFGAATRDDRQAVTPGVTGVVGTSAAPAGLPPAGVLTFFPQSGVVLKGPWMSTGVLSLNAVTTLVNASLDLYARFRVRPLQKGERP